MVAVWREETPVSDPEFERLERWYTRDRVYATLERWHHADAKVSTTDDDVRVKRHKKPALDPEKSRVIPRSDVRSALARLAQLGGDHIAEADAIIGYYIDLATIGDADKVAAWQGVHRSTVYRRIDRGVHQIAKLLRPDDDDGC